MSPLLQELCHQVKQLLGYRNVRVLYRSIGQIPMMPDIGSTVAAKSESVHLDPVAPQPIKTPSGVIYYPLWEHRVLVPQLQV